LILLVSNLKRARLLKNMAGIEGITRYGVEKIGDSYQVVGRPTVKFTVEKSAYTGRHTATWSGSGSIMSALNQIKGDAYSALLADHSALIDVLDGADKHRIDAVHMTTGVDLRKGDTKISIRRDYFDGTTIYNIARYNMPYANECTLAEVWELAWKLATAADSDSDSSSEEEAPVPAKKTPLRDFETRVGTYCQTNAVSSGNESSDSESSESDSSDLLPPVPEPAAIPEPTAIPEPSVQETWYGQIPDTWRGKSAIAMASVLADPGANPAAIMAAAGQLAEATRIAARIKEIQAKLTKYAASGDPADLGDLI
jgi:hypothetical protein